MDRRLLLGGLAAGVSLLGLAATASAGPMFDTSTSSCTTDNCSSVSVGGSLLAFGSSFASPWVGQIFAFDNQCLRLDVTSASNDLEIVAVQPNGRVFRDDDSGVGNRPLVKINGTKPGWYTVQVSTFNGEPVDADFTLAFGLYNVNNPNCANPTSPTAAAVDAAKSRSAISGPGPTGGPASGR